MKKKRVVVLGAGFGGLTFCQSFRHPQASLTIVDRQNHHLFQPLLYQVATAGLAQTEIAQPVRSIFSDRPDISVLMDSVESIDLKGRIVRLGRTELNYDYLVIGLGVQTRYFGHPEWREIAPGLKSLDDAIRIRREVLVALERAEDEPDPAERRRLMTIVIVGGGPTGVELAGAFAELARHVLKKDFRRIDPTQARIVLVQSGDRLLKHLPARLSRIALDDLEKLGVEVHLNSRVTHLEKGEVHLGEQVVEAENIIWAAGISASEITESLGVPLDRAGRFEVNPSLGLPGHPEVFAIGDIASIHDADGNPVPGVSPAAMQMGRHVASIIQGHLDHRSAVPYRPPPFRYWDKGSMATIGRSSAVAWIGRLEMSGFIAWLAWMFVHLIFLVGFRNKVAVVLQWAYAYFVYKRGARIVTKSIDDIPPATGWSRREAKSANITAEGGL